MTEPTGGDGEEVSTRKTVFEEHVQCSLAAKHWNNCIPQKCNELPAGPNPAAKVKVIEVDQADPGFGNQKVLVSGIPMPNAELMKRS